MFYREPEGLKLLVKLYVERSYSVWKEPEVCVVYTVVGRCTHCCVSQTTRHFQVLTWLEANCRVAVCRADQNDPLISEHRDRYILSLPIHVCALNRQLVYIQTSELPRGILESLGIFIVTFSYLIWTVWLLPYHR